MSRTIWVSVLVIILLPAASANGQEGRLQRVRDDINAPAPPASASSSSGNDQGFSSDSNDDGGFSGTVFGIVVLSPFYLPIAMLGDRYEQSLPFAPHPYADGYRGYQIMSLAWATTYYETDTADIPRKGWAVRLSLDNGSDFNGMNRVGGQLKVEHESRFGMVTNWNYYRERLRCGCIDEMLIGDTNLTFRFAQNEWACMYAGLGFRILSDRRQTDFGFNATYGGDWFPVRPIVVSGVIDAGNLGSAGVFRARGSVGAIWYGVEVFGGYDFLRIGSTNLQGPMAGVRFWF